MTNVFEEKNISKAILVAGIPAMIGQLTTLIYNLADTWFVSLTKEPAQIAAVTLCTPILLIMMSIANIFAMGASSVIARLLGEGKRKEPAGVFIFSIYSTVISGVIVLIAGLFLIEPIANMIGADSSNIGYTIDYLRWIFLGAPFVMTANCFVHTFRSLGMIRQSMVGLILGNAINIVLDFVFIVLLNMGTAGAALATSIGFLCACIYGVIGLIRQRKKGNDLITFRPMPLRGNKNLILQVIKIGIPGALVTVLMSVANIVLNNFIAIYGSDAVASYGIAYRIDMFPIMLVVGFSQGIAPLIGYDYGAGRTKRLEGTMARGMLFGTILGTAFMVLFIFFRTPLAGIFMHEDRLIEQTAYFLLLLCFHAPLLGVINMVTTYFQALGKAGASLAITLLRNVGLFIPGVMILNYFFQLDGVILTQLIVECIMTVICLIMYTSARPRKIMNPAAQ